MAEAILGISLGTRRIGFAVVRDGKLIYSQMKTFPGAWSEKKLRRVIQTVTGYVESHSLRRVAIKIPDALPSSKAFIQLTGSLNLTFQRKGVQFRYYTLKELKHLYVGTEDVSRTSLIESIVKRYPRLLPEYQREKRNEEAYYYKMFEAVLCADMHRLAN